MNLIAVIGIIIIAIFMVSGFKKIEIKNGDE